MRPRGIETAEGRLHLCRRAYDELVATFPILHKEVRAEGIFKRHWLDFLVQWKGAYMKVQQAAKDTPQEMQWFDAVNKERRGDPLLRYIYEARNDEEHELTNSVHYSGLTHRIKGRGDNKVITIKRLRPNASGNLDFLGPDNRPINADIIIEPGKATLMAVTERNGKRKVPPPTSHMGVPIEPEPMIAAELSLKWLENLVALGRAMIGP